MPAVPVILIFDVGKTNKKVLLFDEEYRVLYEDTCQLEEITDEDGFACEDVRTLTEWMINVLQVIDADPRFSVKAIHFSAYGASFVLLDKEGKVIAPLYNYLKPYDPALQKKFYDSYGGESSVAKQTASPVLGNLNSGMQLYRLKYERPDLFDKLHYALHLPQYLSYVLCGVRVSDITSIGCHTNLWSFTKNTYHEWVQQEGVLEKLAPLVPGNEPAGISGNGIPVGPGLHDSSAALIPYLVSFTEPFILLSTGTWCISLNPFNNSRLTDYELHQDCLCYLSYKGEPVKASRLFAGYEHELQIKRLAEHFAKPADYYKTVKADPALLKKFKPAHSFTHQGQDTAMIGQSAFASRSLEEFPDYETAYHRLIADIIQQQVRSTSLVLKGTAVTRIFVDGGFSRNEVFMYLLADAFPEQEVYAASVAQASSLGAALALHKSWNTRPYPPQLISLRLYTKVDLPA